MNYATDRHHRRSIRLKGYDYSQAGAYFVTVCAQDRECFFGDIVDGEIQLNNAGQMVQDVWHNLPVKYPDIETDEFVVMPNHVHGIIVMRHDNCRGEVSSPIFVSPIPTMKQGGETPPLQKRTLGNIVAYFKYQTTKQINRIRNTPGVPLWQRNYYEHIIRNEEEMNRICEYIIENPIKWTEDEDNPDYIISSRSVMNHAPTNM